MSILNRFRDWWLGQLRGQRGLGKVVWVAAPLMFACCGLTLFSAVLSPPDVEPTAVVAERAAAMVELAEVEATAAPTDEPATVEPTVEPPTATRAATRTAAPTATDEPTRPPVRVATALAETVVADQLTVTAAPATATRVMPTATNPPPTATAVRSATIALPSATQPPATVAPTSVPPTAVPPTAVPPTSLPPTAVPQPTATLPTAAGSLAITNVNKREEFVDIQNVGGVEVVLDGWTLRSEKGSQDCRLSGVLGPGQSLRIWAMAEDAGQGGFNCQFGTNIWNNDDPDAAVLIDPSGAEVSRR